jgi:hypothetical protein
MRKDIFVRPQDGWYDTRVLVIRNLIAGSLYK